MHDSLPEIPGFKAPEELAAEFRHEVARLLNRNKLTFPGAQPVSFTRRHLEALCDEEYVSQSFAFARLIPD
jgi:mRNA guanylyltransferase